MIVQSDDKTHQSKGIYAHSDPMTGNLDPYTYSLLFHFCKSCFVQIIAL